MGDPTPQLGLVTLRLAVDVGADPRARDELLPRPSGSVRGGLKLQWAGAITEVVCNEMRQQPRRGPSPRPSTYIALPPSARAVQFNRVYLPPTPLDSMVETCRAANKPI